MSKRHQSCHDIYDLCEAILQLVNDDSVIDAATSIGLRESLSLLGLSAETLKGKAALAHDQVMKELETDLLAAQATQMAIKKARLH